MSIGDSGLGRPRLKDVASLAGVSTATVSRVVNGRPGVSEDVRDRVTDALRQLQWEPSGLRGSRQVRTVGLLVPELTNPIFPTFAQGIERRLGLSGMTTVLCTSTPEGVSEAEHVEELLEMGVAALVFVAGSHADTEADHSTFHDLAARGVSVIVVNGRSPDLAGIASVTCDDVEAGRLATSHLLSLGHRRIGLAAGGMRYIAGQRRADGWAKALSDAGLAAGAVVGPEGAGESAADGGADGAGAVVGPRGTVGRAGETPSPLYEDTYTISGGRRAGEVLLEEGVTAIVAASDLIAIGVLQAARARGLRIPEDLSVVGYDDSLLMPHVDPPLTTVRQPVDDICRAIARLCVAASNGKTLRTSEMAFHPELIARASTGPAPGLVSG